MMMMITLKSEFVVDTALHSARTRASIGVDICVLLGPSDLPATHIFAKQNLARAPNSQWKKVRSVSRALGTSNVLGTESCGVDGVGVGVGVGVAVDRPLPLLLRRSISVSRAVIIIASVKLNCLRGRGANELWRQLAWLRGHTGFAPEYPKCMLLLF